MDSPSFSRIEATRILTDRLVIREFFDQEGETDVDGSASVVVRSDVLELVAKNGAIVRSGELGAFEPPMWQVIDGQGVRQMGALYAMDPDNPEFYAKLSPPSARDGTFSIHVDLNGQSLLALDTTPLETRVPARLSIGPSAASTPYMMGTSAERSSLVVRAEGSYGVPVAVFCALDNRVDAGLLVQSKSETALVSMECASGLIRLVHRSASHTLAFFNERTQQDFMSVDTRNGNLRILGTLFQNIDGGTENENDIAFDKRLVVTTGELTLAEALFRSSADDNLGTPKGVLTIDNISRLQTVASVYAPSFVISKPITTIDVRTFGFNTYVDESGALRHVDAGSAVTLSHVVRGAGSTPALSTLSIGFSQNKLQNAVATPVVAFEASESGQLNLTNTTAEATGGALMIDGLLGRQWRMRVSAQGDLIFEHRVVTAYETDPPWSTRFRVVGDA